MNNRDGAATRHRLVAEERRQLIRDLLGAQGIASLSEIMHATGASEATARRDLLQLEQQGFVRRNRGGASLVQQKTTLEEAFAIRQRRERREKRMIGERAAELLTDNMTVFLNDGTTSHAVAQCITRRRLTVATTALNIAQLLAASPSVEVIVIGGRLRGTSFGTTGPFSTDAVSMMHADVAVIGADGVSLSGGVRAHTVDDAAVARAMSENASLTVVLASPAKIDVVSGVRILDWPRVNALVTASLPNELAEGLKKRGVRVISAE